MPTAVATPMQSYALPVVSIQEADSSRGGWVWRVLMIQPGISKNRILYKPEVLRESARLFQGVRAMARSDEDHMARQGTHARDVIGWFDPVEFVEGEGLVGDFHITGDADWLRQKFLSASEAGKLDLLGFSIVAEGYGHVERQGGHLVNVIDKIVEAHFVDVVVNPGAGGRVLSLVEAADTTARELRMLEKLWSLIEGKNPELLNDVDRENVTEAQLLELMESHWSASDDDDGADEDGPGGTAVATQTQAHTHQRPSGQDSGAHHAGAASQGYDIRMQEALQQIESMSARLRMSEALNTANLPQPVQQKVEAQFQAEINAGAYPTEQRIQTVIEAERTMLSQMAEAGKVQGLGRSHIDLVRDATDKNVDYLNDFFDGKPGARSFQEAYVRLTGDGAEGGRITGRIVSPQHMDALREYALKSGLMSLSESITTTGFDVVLADTIHRRMVEEYNRSVYSAWRQICSIGSLPDMRQQHRVRYGGYGDLPIVYEEDIYPALASPTDEEATYLPRKRGGTEQLSLEAIWNDDVDAIRRIPQRLARTAARTLYKFVFNTLIADNPTIYDGVALFHADHDNLTSTAFSTTQFLVHWANMAKQPELDSGERLGFVPRYILHPVDLAEPIYNGFVRTTNNDPNFAQTQRPTPINVIEWTDTNNWYSVASPMDCPTIEIGFFDGEEPQLFRQDLPNVGSVFTNDMITWKIRHIYGGCVKDYRAFQGAIVA